MPEHERKHHHSADDCEKAGVPVAGLTAEYSDDQAAAFYAGVMARTEGTRDDPDETPEDIELRVPYQRGYAYADANSGDYIAHVYGQEPQPRRHDPEEKAGNPPDGIRITPAQRGGSSRGNEENTNPHPGQTGDRQGSKGEMGRSGRQHAGSKGDAQATPEERKEQERRAGK